MCLTQKVRLWNADAGTLRKTLWGILPLSRLLSSGGSGCVASMEEGKEKRELCGVANEESDHMG
jgi:hypothetical protein